MHVFKKFRSWVRRFLPTTYTLRINCVLIVRAQCSLPRQLGPSLGSAAIICSTIFSCDCMKVFFKFTSVVEQEELNGGFERNFKSLVF